MDLVSEKSVHHVPDQYEGNKTSGDKEKSDKQIVWSETVDVETFVKRDRTSKDGLFKIVSHGR
jgi:hypothetical protein